MKYERLTTDKPKQGLKNFKARCDMDSILKFILYARKHPEKNCITDIKQVKHLD